MYQNLNFEKLANLSVGRHTINRKNRFIAILVPSLSFVIFIVCRNYRCICRSYHFAGCIYRSYGSQQD